MLKLEALDRNTVRNIRLTDDTAYAEASIDWPALYSTEHPGQPAIEIRVEASVPLDEFSDPKRAVEFACQKAVVMLNAAFQARFPNKRPITFEEAVLASKLAERVKPAVPSDFDDGSEGDPQAIWDNRLRHLNVEDRARVDDIERRLIDLVTDRPLKRRLRGGVGWDIGKEVFLSVEDAFETPTSDLDGLIESALGRHV